MKRWVSGAMALIITFSLAQGSFACATEVVEEAVVSVPVAADEAVDESVEIVEAYEAEVIQAEAFDLPIEEDGAAIESPETPEIVEDEALAAYVAVAPGAQVREAPEGVVLATLDAEGIALLLGKAAEGWSEIAVYTRRGVVTGCAAEESLRALEAEEVSDYMDALTLQEDVAAYEGDANRPLGQIACTFADEVEAPDEDAGEVPAEEPAVEAVPAQEPEPEAADEPAAPADAESAGEADAPREGEETVNAEGGEADENAGTTETVEAAENAGTDNTTETVETAEAVETTEIAETQEASADAAIAAEAVPEDTEAQPEVTEKADETANNDDTAYAATGVQLNATAIALGLKESYSGLKATGGSGAITWSTSNNKVVAVEGGTGVIRGVKKGSAVITATSADGMTASVKVTVKAAPKKIKFKPRKAKMGSSGNTLQLKLAMNKGSACAGIIFTSSDENVATVDSTGLVTSHVAGTAQITASTYNGKKATCELTVYSVPAPAAIRLPKKISLGAKETLAKLPVELVPGPGATECAAEITWSSTDKKVVKVDPVTGEIKALKKGKATIVARAANGMKAKCKVTVKKAPKKIAMKSAPTTVDVGATAQFSIKLPKGTACSGITWTSSKTDVAVVDQEGKVTGIKAGRVEITATTYNGKTASATLTVKNTTSGSTDTGSKSEVQVPSSMAKLGIASYQNVYSADLSNEEKLEYVIYCAQNQLGKPYVYGKGYSSESDPSGFDCSGLVYWCFNRVHIKLEASAYKQGYDNKYTKISDIDSLKRGDVVCFNTSSDNDLSDHTGIYLGNGYFIHASSGSSKRKVCVQRFTGDAISSDYYKRAFSWGRRILN